MSSEILQSADIEIAVLLDEFNRLVRGGDNAFVVGSRSCNQWEESVRVLRGVLSKFPQYKDWVFSQTNNINSGDGVDFTSLPDDDGLSKYLLEVSPAYKIYLEGKGHYAITANSIRSSVAGLFPVRDGMPGFGPLVGIDAA